MSVDENKDAKLALLKAGVSLQDLVQGLNALGIGPRDMISILQSIKAAGALQSRSGAYVMSSSAIQSAGDLAITQSMSPSLTSRFYAQTNQ